jgi:hypothetical protein
MMWDAQNVKSYPGSGTTWTDIISKNTMITGASGVAPTFFAATSTSPAFFRFNGSTQHFQSGTTNTSTNDQQMYTRLAWVRVAGGSGGGWGPILQNQIGNNSDMTLGVTSSGANILMHHYNNTGNFGQSQGDYDAGTSASSLTANTWYQVGISVSRTYRQVYFWLNGTLDTTAYSINLLGNASSNGMMIGGTASALRMFNGDIAIVQHFNNVLLASDVAQNFNALRSRFGI